MSGFTAMWACYCSDASDVLELLPETCPEHGAALMAPPVPNPLLGGVAPGHRCNTTHTHPSASAEGDQEASA